MTDLARARDLSAELAAKGVQFCIAAYVDVHGVPKGKAVLTVVDGQIVYQAP